MADEHVDRSQVAVARVIIRQALNSPRLRESDPLAVAIALESVGVDLRQGVAAMDTDIFATMNNLREGDRRNPH